MKKLLLGFLAIGAIAGIQSCSTSNDVVSSGLFQKRKFNKGYHFAGFAKGQDKATELNKEYEFTPVNEVDAKAPILEASITKTNPGVLAVNNTATNNTAPAIFASSTSKKEVKRQAKKVMKQVKKMKKESTSTNKPGMGDSQLIALILAIVVGGLGIHRFYLGYIGIGVIQLLTAGGCGVWALIDIIRIAMGTLGPKDGSYTDTL